MRALEKVWEEEEEEGGERGLFQGWVSGESQDGGGLLAEERARRMEVCLVAWLLVVEMTRAVASRFDPLFPFLSRRDVALLFLAFVVQGIF